MTEALESPKINSIMNSFVAILHYVCAGTTGLFLAILFIQIFLRYVFNSPIYGMEEGVTLLMVWSMAIGNTVVYWKHEHAVIEFVLRHVPEIFTRVIQYITSSIVFLSALVYVYGGAILFKMQVRTMPLGGLPFSRAYYYALPIIVMGIILFILSIARLGGYMISDLKNVFRQREKNGGQF